MTLVPTPGRILNVLAVLGLFGSAASICALVLMFYSPASRDVRFGLLLLASFAWAFIILALWQEFWFARKTRHAEASPSFQEAYLLAL